MIREEYSPYKIIHHWDKLQEIKNGGQIYPSQLQLVISDLCNHNCSFCAYRMDGYTSNKNFGVLNKETNIVNNNPNRMIPYEKCIEIIDDCIEMGTNAIQFTGGGEPTVHPKHKEIFEYVIDKKMELALVSNGYIIKDGIPDILSNASWTRFSMDAGTKETYSSIRRIDINGFDRFKKNVKLVVDAKIKNKGCVIIGIGFVVTKDNYKDICEATKIARDLGVDNIRMSAVFTPEDAKYHLDYYEESKQYVLEAKQKYESPEFSIFNLFGDRVQDLIQKRPDYDKCMYMQFNTYIGGDLKVYSCCNNAYNEIGEIGSIKDIRFKDFWDSKTKKEIFDKFNPKKCERCMFNNKNEFALYCIKENPKHINFV